MRHTRAHSKNRRSHHALKGARLSTTKEGGQKHPRHRALLDGTPYRGRSVMDLLSKRILKKQKKADAAPKNEEAKQEVNEEKVEKLEEKAEDKK